MMKFPWNRKTWEVRAGTHSHYLRVEMTRDERLVFALLEAIDYECWNYGDCPKRPTQKQAVTWLKRRKALIKKMNIEPPSYLGAFCGAFDFLA